MREFSDEANWQVCPKDGAEHVLAVTGVQTVTWLLWSVLTSNESCHTITGCSGTQHPIMTKAMTCHFINSIHSTMVCKLDHVTVSVWRATSLSSSVKPICSDMDVYTGNQNNLFNATQLGTDYLTDSWVEWENQGCASVIKKVWRHCLDVCLLCVTVCTFSGLARGNYL